MIKKQQRQKTWRVKHEDGNKYQQRGNIQLSVRLEAEESIIRTRIEMLNEQLKQLEVVCLDPRNQPVESEDEDSKGTHLEVPPIPAPR